MKTPRKTTPEIVTWAQSLGRHDEIVSEIEAKARKRQRRIHRRRAAVASLTVVLVLGLWFTRSGAPQLDRAIAGAALVIAPARQSLPDGTTVELNEGAVVVPQFTAGGTGVRRVVLERGVAHFSVRKNPLRPFIVVAGSVEIRAVGTAFAVELAADRVAVTVTEGTVAVERDRASSTLAAQLDAGNRIEVALGSDSTTASPAEKLSSEKLAAHLSWRVPRVRFDDTPLSEAVAAFNDYAAVKLELDPALGALRIGGIVRADNTDSFLRLLHAEFGIEAVPGEGRIQLVRRPGQPKQ